MKSRKRMLFVAPRCLVPADSGGKIRTAQVLRGLKGGAFDITLVSPAPAQADAKDASELKELCDRFASWPKGERTRSLALSRVHHLFSQLPVSVASDMSPAGRSLIASELARKPDLVVIDFPHTAILAPDFGNAASVLFTHNVEAEIFSRQIKLARDPLRRAIWRDQWQKMQRFELETLRRFDAVIAVSERDGAHFRQEFGIEARVIPTGVDLDRFAYEAPAGVKPSNPKIVFTASMDYHANIDGIRWFMDACWPLISAALPEATLTVVGRNPPPSLVNAAAKRGLLWTFTGFVDDVRPHIHDALIYIIPLRVGGGTRIKAFEAMALGRPVVSTSIGMEGLSVEPEKHFLLADTPQLFAEAVLRLARDPLLRTRIAGAARNLVETRFSAQAVARAFEQICLDTLASATRLMQRA